MTRIFDYDIEPSSCNLSIQNYLTQHGYSAPILTHLKKTPNGVLLNERWDYMNTRLQPGDHLSIRLQESSASNMLVPYPLPLSICYEDEDLMVVNKPYGLPVHPSLRHPEKTLANAVCYYFNKQHTPCTFRCVNRLDRDTTGLTIIAKHMLSSAILNGAIKDRTISREYLAVADGYVPDCGTINAPIGKKSSAPHLPSIKRQIDLLCGKRAVTHYKRLLYHNGRSLVSLHLDTGRTHQIRVHMSYIGHPLIGDFLYHPDYTSDLMEQTALSNRHFCQNLKRQALHACRLQFLHPITKLPLEFTAPLPKDMECLL